MGYKSVRFVFVAFLAVVCLSLSGLAAQVENPLGRVTERLSAENADCIECSLGDASADAVRKMTGADVVIVAGGSVRADLPICMPVYSDIEAVFSRDDICTAQVNPAGLLSILEQGVSHIVADGESELIDRTESAYAAFPQVSGIRFCYDATAPAGSRVKEIWDEEGALIYPGDVERRLTLAASDLVFIESGLQGEPTGMTLTEAFADYLILNGEMSAPESRRITPIGVNERPIISMLSPAMLLFLAVALCAGSFIYRKLRRF